MPITFDDAFVYDNNEIMSLEDVFRNSAAFAGIHSFSFDSLVDDAFSGLGDWTDAEGVWAILGGGAVGTATATGGGFDFAPLWHDEETRSSTKITGVLQAGNTGACIIFRGDGDDDYYVAEITATTVAFYFVDGGSTSTLSKLTHGLTITFPCTFEVGVHQDQYSEYTQDRWLFMTLSINGRVMLSAAHNIPDDVPGTNWGLAVAAGYNAMFENVRVPDLADVISWASIDPNESARTGINRAVGDRVVVDFARYDGTLRVFRPKATTSQQTFTKTTSSSLATPVDHRELAAHVRLHFATGEWVDAFDSELYAYLGHKFVEVVNDDIWHEDEAYEEAEAILRRMRERALMYHVTLLRGGFLLELEDRITLPDGDAIVDSLSFSRERGIVVSIRGRRYEFE